MATTPAPPAAPASPAAPATTTAEGPAPDWRSDVRASDRDPKTGQAVHNPAAKVAVYPLKMEGGDVLIDL